MLFILFILLSTREMLAAIPAVSINQNTPDRKSSGMTLYFKEHLRTPYKNVSSFLAVTAKKPLPNYYWRKYEGVIPDDAIPGGYTPNGERTYIGQVLLIDRIDDQGLIPGVIYAGQIEVVAVFDEAYKSKRYNTILCSDTPSALKWRTVNEHEIYLVHDYLVVGGYEISQNAYIGRVSYANHLIVGKVFTEHSKGLKIATPDGRQESFTSFELLVYDPED